MHSNSKTVGDETEIEVIRKIIRAGRSIAIPFGDNDKYDLLMDTGDSILRVQCKTAWEVTPGNIRFNAHSQTTRDGEYLEAGYSGEIDAFAVRYPNTEEFFWIPIEEAADHSMHLRFEAAIDHPSINWADEYRLEDRLP